LGEFIAKKNEFLVFEEGPSVDVVLQWATYRDASDQTSLSRIWGGIHPPADDIPGRFIGQEVAEDTFEFAVPYFNSSLTIDQFDDIEFTVYPNPTLNKRLFITNTDSLDTIELFDIRGREISIDNRRYDELNNTTSINLNSATPGLYMLSVNRNSKMIVIKD
jgi:hypothetical protein